MEAEHCRVAGRKQMGHIVYFPWDLLPEDLCSKHFGRQTLNTAQALCSPLSPLASAKLSWSFAALLEGGRLLVEGILPLYHMQ